MAYQQGTEPFAAPATGASDDWLEPLPFSPDQVQQEIKRVRRGRIVKIALAVILVAIVAAIIAVAIVFKVPGSLYTVKDDRMIPALSQGQVVLMQPVETPSDGDIVAYNVIVGGADVRRIVASPGEWVNVASDGTFVISTSALPADSFSQTVGKDVTLVGAQQVPPNTYFVMPDSVSGSETVLEEADNFITVDRIVGKVSYSVWPLTAFGPVK